MICLKNCTFVESTTTHLRQIIDYKMLWFAWKIVPLWNQQQPTTGATTIKIGCDLLEKLYLCGINNNMYYCRYDQIGLWFAWKIVPLWNQQQQRFLLGTKIIRCDLLEKLYLCGINNNRIGDQAMCKTVVICLKNCTFVESTTTCKITNNIFIVLWFAWKIVPLWNQQQQTGFYYESI